MSYKRPSLVAVSCQPHLPRRSNWAVSFTSLKRRYNDLDSRGVLRGYSDKLWHSSVPWHGQQVQPTGAADTHGGCGDSHSGEWLAVSNHYKNCVFIFKNDNSLDEESEPIGTLQGMSYPHGLRFSQDDKYIFVADAGAPVVHVYKMDHRRWSGEHFPVYDLRIMDDETFSRGHINPEEGGPKGIDLSSDDQVLVASCEEEPIVFFDVRKVFEPLSVRPHTPSNQHDNITETERMRLSLLGHINLISKAETNARTQVDELKKIVAAGLQEQNMLTQQLNDHKK